MPLTAAQIAQLLQPINPKRVLTANGQSHVSQQDVAAHLTRIFGFEGWDKEILDLRCIRDTTIDIPATDKKPARKDVPSITYLCRLRLTVRDPDGAVVKVIDDVGTGTSPNLPTHGDAHDFAAKNAVSYALKRCAKDLGDQFGLSLYNKGQRTALVKGTLVRRNGQDVSVADVQDGVEQQVSLGDTDGGEPAAHERPEPEQDGATILAANDLRSAIREFAQAQGWDLNKIAVAFESDYDMPIRQAPAELLQTFLDILRQDAQAEAAQAAAS